MELLDFTAIQRDLLYVLASEDQQPTPAIRAELDDYYPREVPDSQLYPALQQLVEMDLARKDNFDERTYAYCLTEQGRDTLATHHEWKYSQIE